MSGRNSRTPNTLRPNGIDEGLWGTLPGPISRVSPKQYGLAPHQVEVKLIVTQRNESGITPAGGSNLNALQSTYREAISESVKQRKRAREEIPVAGPSTNYVSFPAPKKPRYELKPDESVRPSPYAHTLCRGHPNFSLLLPTNSQVEFGLCAFLGDATSRQRTVGNSGLSCKGPPPSTRPHGSAIYCSSPQFPLSELDVFLQNVMGLDLSVHRELLLAQGLDMDRIRIMAGWSHDDRQRFLHFLLKNGAGLLRGKKGLTLFEIMSLEFVIGELGNSG
ncbi:hypothetical protein C8R44DRAFT_865000 [Mycena epipterygia]|nr:hypothetical protein C8R44DRAFT_865000 [Mycena epipterygia]